MLEKHFEQKDTLGYKFNQFGHLSNKKRKIHCRKRENN